MRNDKVISCFSGYFFYSRQHGCDEVTVKLMDNDANRVRLLPAKIAGEMIRTVSHFLGQVKDSLPRFLAYYRIIFEPSADGCNGNIELAGKIVYRDFLSFKHTNGYNSLIKLN